MSKSKATLTDVLKAAIEESGLTQYRIAQDTGILATSLSRFMRDETSLRLDKADILADYLGLELEATKGEVTGRKPDQTKGEIMGTVFKKTFTKPLPAGAKIIVRKGQRLAEWIDAKGKTRTAPLTVAGDRIAVERRHLHRQVSGRLGDRPGSGHRLPG